MGLGIRKSIKKIYINKVLLSFTLRKFLYGFDNALKILINVNKEAIIPILKKYGAKIGVNCDIESPIFFHNCFDFKNLIVGDNCHIGKNCFFDLRDKIEIGNNVVISMQTTFITHIDLSNSSLRSKFPQTSKQIKIMNNCYIGTNSTILLGCQLGESSFVAAGSLVRENVEPFTMVGGVPAKVIKKIV